MKILIITQNEPFYLYKNLDNLIFELSRNGHSIVGCVCSEPSVFGEKLGFIKKIIKTLKVFGLKFFCYYSYRYVYSKIFARSINHVLDKWFIKRIQIENGINHPDSIRVISSYCPDLIISILGTEIFKKNFLEISNKGVINLHTSLLPKYRGIMPTFWVLKNCEKSTGVTVFFVDQGIDSGKIILQEEVKILSEDTQEKLIEKTKKIGMKLIVDSVEIIKRGNFNLIDNNDEESTYFSFPTNEDVKEFIKRGKRFF